MTLSDTDNGFFRGIFALFGKKAFDNGILSAKVYAVHVGRFMPERRNMS